MKRRRPRRHRLNLLRLVPNETWANIIKAVLGGLVVAAPAVAVKTEGDNRTRSANQTAAVALEAVAQMAQENRERDDHQDRVIALMQLEIMRLKAQNRKLTRASPAMQVGPELPQDWYPQPPKKKHWWSFGKG